MEIEFTMCAHKWPTSMTFLPSLSPISAFRRWAPGTELKGTKAPSHGREIFVISGDYADDHGQYGQHTWIRYALA